MKYLIRNMILATLLTLFQTGLFASYIAVIDAGSSGSRIYLYNVTEENGKVTAKNIPLDKKTSKIQPGISNYASSPEKVGAEHIAPLIKALRDGVSAQQLV